MSLEEILPEGLEGKDALLAKFGGQDGIEKLARGYMELEKFRGRSVSLPEGDDSESWSKVMEKLGAPGSSEGYILPDGADEDLYGHLRETAASAQLTQRQFETLARQSVERQQAQELEANQSAINAVESIQNLYGTGYDAALARANRAAQSSGVAEGWQSNPEMFGLLEKIGAQMSGSTAPDGTGQPSSTGNAKKVAARLREVMLSEAYTDSFHESHEQCMLLADQLREELNDMGYDSVLHPDLLSDHSPFKDSQEVPRPWSF